MEEFSLRYADFRRVDLNLLVAFDALMEERHVGKAAARLFIGQPAMSHALSRLRETLDDALFIRSGNKMEPTERARQLAPGVKAWLQEAGRLLFAADEFDPRTAEATIRVALMDGLEAILLPPLINVLWHSAHGVKLWVRHLDRDQILSAIDAEEVDVAIGSTDLSFKPWHNCQSLVKSRFDCVYSARQLQLPSPISPQLLADLEQVAMSSRGEMASEVDRFFESRGLQRNIVASAVSQIAICRILSALPVVTIQPAIYTSVYQSRPDLAIAPIDADDLCIDVRLVWHRRNDRHPVHAFLRQTIQRVLAKELEGAAEAVPAWHHKTAS